MGPAVLETAPPFFCLVDVSRKQSTLTPAQVSEFERLRRETVAASFDDAVLKGAFDLGPRAAAFAREYALTGNAQGSAKVAGYSRQTAIKAAGRLVKQTARAVGEIRQELETVGASFRARLSGYMAGALIDVIEMRREFPGAAVLAVKALNDIFPPDPEPIRKEARIIDLDAIKSEAEKLGIYGE